MPRPASGRGSANEPLTRWPVATDAGSVMVSAASPAVETTLAVVDAEYSRATPGRERAEGRRPGQRQRERGRHGAADRRVLAHARDLRADHLRGDDRRQRLRRRCTRASSPSSRSARPRPSAARSACACAGRSARPCPRSARRRSRGSPSRSSAPTSGSAAAPRACPAGRPTAARSSPRSARSRPPRRRRARSATPTARRLARRRRSTARDADASRSTLQRIQPVNPPRSGVP